MNIRISDQNKMTAITLTVIFFIYLSILLVALQFDDAKYDEYFHHYPTLLAFCESGISTIYNEYTYKSAYPPLPFLVSLYSIKLFNLEPKLINLRIFNVIISFLTICVLLFLLKSDLDISLLLTALLIFLFYPYFLKNSISFYLGIYGLSFMVLFYLIDRLSIAPGIKAFLSGLVSVFAGLSQQYLLVLPLIYIWYLITRSMRGENKKDLLKDAAYFVMPLFILVFFYLSWGGLTASGYRYHGVSFQPHNFTVLLMVIGIWFFPFLLTRIQEIKLIELSVSAALSFLLVIFLYPQFGDRPESGQITGLTFKVLNHVEKFSSGLALVVKTLIGTSAILILKSVLPIKGVMTNLRLLSVPAFFAVFMFTEMLSERHLIPLVFILHLIILPEIKSKKVMIGWAGLQVIAGLLYLFNYLVYTKNYPL